MENANTPKQQWIQVVEEYLTAARECLGLHLEVNTSRPSRCHMLGYSVTLLLLCATDAIGHGLLPPICKNGRRVNTRLDVLMQPPFDLNPNLDSTKVRKLTSWYRNMLAHTGTMSPNVFLEPAVQGEPFGFDNDDAPTLIRVPVLYEVIKAAWERRDKDVFYPPEMSGLPLPKPPVSSYGFAASGVVSLSGS